VGQKVNPNGFRLGIIYDWKSRWFATKKYGDLLENDVKIRKHVVSKTKRAGISKIEIERSGNNVKVDIHTARPGIVIGKRGVEVGALRSELEKITGNKVQINIQEVKTPEIDANLVAQNVASQLEARVSFRRAMKRAVRSAMKSGAKGVRINCAGRLGGSEMSRREWYREGRVPLHTLRAEIDYGFAVANSIFGSIGVKVWIYKGDVIEKEVVKEEREENEGVKEIKKIKVGDRKKEKIKVEERKGKLEIKAEAKAEIKSKQKKEVIKESAVEKEQQEVKIEKATKKLKKKESTENIEEGK